MDRPRPTGTRTARVLACCPAGLAVAFLMLAPCTAGAQGSEPTDLLAAGRALLVEGSYEEAIAILTGLVEESRDDPEMLQPAYLQLINAYYLAGNHYRLRARGAVTSDLYYKRGDELILECLLTPGLQHTVPDPPEDFPPEMLAAFERLRAEHFGALRLIQLRPPEALVLLDEEIIKPAGEAPLPEIRNLPAGEHRIVVRADGYQERTEPIPITPGVTAEREYELDKKKGVWWWSLRVGGAAAAGIAIALLVNNSGGDATLPDLPGEPPPPPVRVESGSASAW